MMVNRRLAAALAARAAGAFGERPAARVAGKLAGQGGQKTVKLDFRCLLVNCAGNKVLALRVEGDPYVLPELVHSANLRNVDPIVIVCNFAVVRIPATHEGAMKFHFSIE